MNDTASAGATHFFAVSTRKLVIMTLSTFGLYELYWFFRNWQAIKTIENIDIWPLARTFFLIFTAPGLFRKIYEHAKSKGFSDSVSVDFLSATFIIAAIMGNVSARLDNQIGAWLFLVSFVSIYPVAQIQNIIGFYNRQIDSVWQPLATYSTFEKIVVVVGGILMILTLISLVPQALGFAII